MVGQPRSTQRYRKRPADDEEYLTARIIELASKYGRFGYRRVTALLRNEGWIVNQQTCGADLAQRGAESASETA